MKSWWLLRFGIGGSIFPRALRQKHHAQIRTLLDRQKEQILAENQAEIRKHDSQDDYDRRSVRKLSENIESQQEELHCARAEELQRRDQQLLHEHRNLQLTAVYCNRRGV